jgi:hypothetical protein
LSAAASEPRRAPPGAHAARRAAGRGQDDGGRPAQIAFALLVLACFAAFFATQRLKHTPTAVQRFQLTPRFSPTPGGHIKQERISFKLARTDTVTVTIVDGAGDTVATLVAGQPVVRYKRFSLRWNGREGKPRGRTLVRAADGTTVLTPRNVGRPAPAGEYRVRVRLTGQGRELLAPRGFTLVRR